MPPIGLRCLFLEPRIALRVSQRRTLPHFGSCITPGLLVLVVFITYGLNGGIPLLHKRIFFLNLNHVFA